MHAPVDASDRDEAEEHRAASSRGEVPDDAPRPRSTGTSRAVRRGHRRRSGRRRTRRGTLRRARRAILLFIALVVTFGATLAVLDWLAQPPPPVDIPVE